MPEPLPPTPHRFLVLDRTCQDLELSIQGDALADCQSHADPEEADEDLVYPDLVKLFMDCANLGMFCGYTIIPNRSRVTVLTETFDPQTWNQNWRLRAENVDPSAFRILYHLFLAQGLDSVSLQPLNPQPQMMGKPGYLGATPRYPARFIHVPFPVDATSPEQSTCPRTLQIQFKDKPSKALLKTTYQVLARWAQLPALGGYAPEDVLPEDSITEPDLAILLDPHTVEQDFLQIFECDEAAFDAVINWAVELHKEHPMAAIRIR